MTILTAIGRKQEGASSGDRLALALTRYWMPVILMLSGSWLGLATLAPLLMAVGLDGPAYIIYKLFSLQCYQLPQRSYFLFGQAGAVQTYSLDQILVWGADSSNLHAFVGNLAIGYKIAFDMRMTALHAALVELRQYLATPNLNLRLVALPAYSPDFNADEAVWDWAREEVTANICFGTAHKVHERLDAFFAALAERAAEVRQRCRTLLQSKADALMMTSRQLSMQPDHVDLTLVSV